MEANERHKKMSELTQQQSMNENGMIAVKGKASLFMKQNKADFMDRTDEQELKHDVSNGLEGILEYGEQYNANHDFAIF